VTSRLPSHLATGVDPRSARSVGGPHFLFVGRLIARKRPVEVVQAFGLARARLAAATMTIVGDGPLMSEVRAAARLVGRSVRVLGRREGTELQRTYRECDVLVLPAKREVWGLVVNEALAHGLYVIASDQVGSAYDLVTPGAGVMLPAGDVRGLPAALIATEGVDPSDAARRRRAQAVFGCTPDRMAIDWARAADLSVERSARRGAVPRRRRAHGAGAGAAASTDSVTTPRHKGNG
jgi:glycosyltransferase involved in cell wall biosynthesis